MSKPCMRCSPGLRVQRVLLCLLWLRPSPPGRGRSKTPPISPLLCPPQPTVPPATHPTNRPHAANCTTITMDPSCSSMRPIPRHHHQQPPPRHSRTRHPLKARDPQRPARSGLCGALPTLLTQAEGQPVARDLPAQGRRRGDGQEDEGSVWVHTVADQLARACRGGEGRRWPRGVSGRQCVCLSCGM